MPMKVHQRRKSKPSFFLSVFQGMLMPGEYTTMTLTFITSVALEKFQRFVLREGGRSIAVGVITDILTPDQ